METQKHHQEGEKSNIDATLKSNWFKAILSNNIQEIKQFLKIPNFDIDVTKQYLNLGLNIR